MATPEQLHEAIRRADAAGDAEAVRALAAALKAGASKQDILATAAQNNLSVDETALDANIAARDAGGQTNEFLPPSRMEQLGQSAQSTVAGIAQGAADVYDFAQDVAKVPTQAMNMATRGVASLADMAGMEGVGGFLRRGADNYDRDLGRISSVADLIEQASPTPEGMEGSRFTSRLLGGMMVPFGPKASPRPMAPPASAPATAAREVIEAGKREDVPVWTSDVRPARTFVGKTARAIGERIPYAGTGGPRAAQQEKRVEAVKNLASDFGAEVSEDYLNDVASDLAKTRGARVQSLTKAKDGVIDSIAGAVPTPRAVSAIDEQIARLRATKNEGVEPVVAELEAFKRTLTSGLDLRNVEENRKILGKAFEGDNMAKVKDIGEKATKAIYGPLRDDMGTFIKQAAGKGAFNTWRKANGELAEMAGELSVNSFNRVLRDAETTPENVANILFSKKPSEVSRLVSNLSPEGKAKAQAAVIHRALVKAGDQTSPDVFAAELNRLGPQIGIVFEGADAARIEGFKRLMNYTKQASVASAAPVTGAQNSVPILAAVLADMLGTAGGAITSGAAMGGMARLYESPAVRNLLVPLSKAPAGSQAEGRILERIIKAATPSAETRAAVTGANDNFGASAAAGQPEEQQ